MNASLQVGYGRRDITPEYSVPLAGYGNTRKRMSQGYVNRIYATCLAFTDTNNETLLVYTVDLIVIRRDWGKALRQHISKATGLPESRIMISATHTHSGPDVLGVMGTDDPYCPFCAEKLAEAAMEALADRTPVTAKTGSCPVPGMTFVRHYNMLDGSVAGDNHGDWSVGIKDHVMAPDDMLQLVRLEREGKQDILMVNWQSHPNVASTASSESGRLLKPFICADFVGTCRSYVEEQTGCLFAYFQGACGNLNSWSRIKEEMPTTDVHLFGQQLGGFVLKAMADARALELGAVQVREETFTGQLDHSEDHLVPIAQEVSEFWGSSNNALESIKFARTKGFHSHYHANAVISRSKAGTELSTQLSAASIGELGFAFAPYEMFCNNGQFVKDNSGHPVTFILECSNDYVSYIASREAFDHGCYEVDSRRFVRGTGEAMAERFAAMLKDMK